MNKVVLMGRLVREPEIRYTQGAEPIAVARYVLAVDRRYKKDGESGADFISCTTFGKSAEFAEKYLGKGIKIAVSGRIQTGSYVNRYGTKVYTNLQKAREAIKMIHKVKQMKMILQVFLIFLMTLKHICRFKRFKFQKQGGTINNFIIKQIRG